MQCCVEDAGYREEQAKREAEEKKIMDTKIQIDGIDLTFGELFQDIWDAKNLYNKVMLIRKGAGKAIDKPADVETAIFGD